MAAQSIAFFVVPDIRTGSIQSPGEIQETEGFDWTGAITGVAGLVLFNVAWNRAPTVGWQSAQVADVIVSSSFFSTLRRSFCSKS